MLRWMAIVEAVVPGYGVRNNFFLSGLPGLRLCQTTGPFCHFANGMLQTGQVLWSCQRQSFEVFASEKPQK